MLVLCGVAYPALVWAAAQLAPGQGQGVQVFLDGRARYPNVNRFHHDNSIVARYNHKDKSKTLSGITQAAFVLTLRLPGRHRRGAQGQLHGGLFTGQLHLVQ